MQSESSLHKPGNPGSPKLAFLGAVGLDYLATVEQYPDPDDKIRVKRSVETGGGNAGNAAATASRLNCDVSLASKIGSDGSGKGILNELADDCIDTSFMSESSTSASPFTYIIADQCTGTRTCIHTPSEAMQPDEINAEALAENVDAVFLDGRHPDAAKSVANAAHCRDECLLVVEAERPRDGLDDLLELADVITFSNTFARSAGHIDSNDDASDDAGLIGLLQAVENSCPNAIAAYRTLGSRGLVCIERDTSNSGSSDCAPLKIESVDDVPNDLHVGPAPIAPSKWHVRVPAKASLSNPLKLAQNSRLWYPTRITASGIASDQIVDSTGAGDALNGATVACLASGWNMVDSLTLASSVAALSLRTLGPRSGLPTRSEIDELVTNSH